MPPIVTPSPSLLLIRRTSDSNSRPVDEAIECRILITDRRTVDDPKKIPANGGKDGDWYVRGENHRVEDGCICRDFGYQTAWYIENVDIMDFVAKHGNCVVSISNEGFNSIEIYDDYREYAFAFTPSPSTKGTSTMPTPKEQIYDTRIEPLVTEILRICKEHKIAVILDFALGYESEDQEDQLKVTSILLMRQHEPSPEMFAAAKHLLPDG